MVVKSNMVAACDCCWGDIVEGDYFMMYEKYNRLVPQHSHAAPSFVPVCLKCAANYVFSGIVKKAVKETVV
jgi:hypothetical protein